MYGCLENELDDNEKPVLNYAAPGCSQIFTSAEYFNDWYNDATPSMNQKLTFVYDGSNYVYDSSSYFPVDGIGCKDKGSSGHNFGHTSEISVWFKYEGGEVFDFRGDDDVWVFVDGRLALDLGGVHGPLSGSFQVDNIADDFGLIVGTNYKLKIFVAERHQTGSNFRVQLQSIFVLACTESCTLNKQTNKHSTACWLNCWVFFLDAICFFFGGLRISILITFLRFCCVYC